jgi:hypothetical protein
LEDGYKKLEKYYKEWQKSYMALLQQGVVMGKAVPLHAVLNAF